MILSVPIYVLKRRAKEMSRAETVPLSDALNRLARAEGYQSWSHLAAADAATGRAEKLLTRLNPAELILLAARPGQGKTLLGLELLVEAIARGRDASFFTLEYTEAQVQAHLIPLAKGQDMSRIQIDTSDDLCAEYVSAQLADAKQGSVAVIDYLQLLDQRRDTPPLDVQLAMLKALATDRNITVICLSQIDRRYDPAAKQLPDIADVRLPNPVDLALFDRTIFLGEGALQLRSVA